MKRILLKVLAYILLALVLPWVLFAGFICTMALFNYRVGVSGDFASSPLRADPPVPMSSPMVLRLVTFNIADAYGFTTNRPERMRAIGAKLTEIDPDIVGFQEAFIEKDRAILADALKGSRLQYHVYYPSGTLGSGLMISSAYPIREHYFHRFSDANPWYRLWEGDWWAGKGIALARLELPGGYYLDFYNTHAQAGRGNPSYRDIRAKQMEELAWFMTASRLPTAPAFIAGDFNTRQGQYDHDIAVSGAGLLRVMTIESGIDFIFAVDTPLYSFETLNTIRIEGRVQGSGPNIFLSRPPNREEFWKLIRQPAEETSLSDHPGFMSTVRIVPQVKPEPDPAVSME